MSKSRVSTSKTSVYRFLGISPALFIVVYGSEAPGIGFLSSFSWSGYGEAMLGCRWSKADEGPLLPFPTHKAGWRMKLLAGWLRKCVSIGQYVCECMSIGQCVCECVSTGQCVCESVCSLASVSMSVCPFAGACVCPLASVCVSVGLLALMEASSLCELRRGCWLEAVAYVSI